MENELLLRGQKVLEAQAFSRLLKARLVDFRPGLARLEVTIAQELLQQMGFVHGGVISYLADNALTFAGGSVLGDCLTSEYKINYLRPVHHEGVLLAEAHVVGSGKTQAVCRCDILWVNGPERKVCAAAQGTIRKSPT